MTIRKIMPADLPSVERGNFICWECTGSYDSGPPEETARKKDENAAGTRSDQYWREAWVAVDGDGQTVMSHMRADPYRIFFDGHSVPMAGIGCVWTLPHCRRRGLIRSMFAEAFKEMKERGQVFSTLFPFSQGYYRRFGYGPCHTYVEWVVPLKNIMKCDTGGTVETFRPGDDVSPYREIYDSLAPFWNGMADREDCDWAALRNLEPSKRIKYAYLWRDAAGHPGGYLVHGKEQRGTLRLLDCGGTFIARDAWAVQALLSYAASYADWYDAIKLTLPPETDLRPFLDIPVVRGSTLYDTTTLSRTLRDSSQTRIVDLPAALKLCRTQGSGALTLHVSDAACPWNHGTWRIEWENGSVTSAAPSGGEPDISMDIADCAAALMGTWDTGQFTWNPGITVHNPKAPAGGLFYRKPWQTADFF